MKQEITSAGTSLKQVPALFRFIPWTPGTRNLDYGGGKYNRGSLFLHERKVRNLVYDPFNRTLTHNDAVMRSVVDQGADTVTLANVLNVIKEPEIRLEVLRRVSMLVKPGGRVYISIHIGKNTGMGAQTSRGWQENRSKRSYLSEIQAVFPDVIYQGGFFICPTRI